MPYSKTKAVYHAVGGTCVAGFFAAVVFIGPEVAPMKYSADDVRAYPETEGREESDVVEAHPQDRPIYIPTPPAVKSIYMTQCVVGTPSFRERLLALAEETEINSIIIDVKDYTGYLGFEPKSENLKPYFGKHCYAPDMLEFVRTLNEKGIYTIARITVFQDPIWAKAHPHLAVQRASDGSVWKDNKGLHFVDVGSKEFWDYIIEISKETHALGFDELNYDYVRYPSDGPMSDIHFPVSGARVEADSSRGKPDQLKDFFAYLYDETRELGIPISADLFGMTTTSYNDLNIGQVLEDALPYFDYVAPMVYPSHYPRGFNGWDNPNNYPYEIIEFVMSAAVERTVAFANATSTPHDIRGRVHKEQLRPWIQDFDYGGDYGPQEVRAQIDAVYDSGLTSWMIWDPANRYTREALLSE